MSFYLLAGAKAYQELGHWRSHETGREERSFAGAVQQDRLVEWVTIRLTSGGPQCCQTTCVYYSRDGASLVVEEDRSSWQTILAVSSRNSNSLHCRTEVVETSWHEEGIEMV